MIKVTTQGGETKSVSYKSGMMVGDALKDAGIEATKKATITVDGKDAGLKTLVNDNSLIVITPKIANG